MSQSLYRTNPTASRRHRTTRPRFELLPQNTKAITDTETNEHPNMYGPWHTFRLPLRKVQWRTHRHQKRLRPKTLHQIHNMDASGIQRKDRSQVWSIRKNSLTSTRRTPNNKKLQHHSTWKLSPQDSHQTNWYSHRLHRQELWSIHQTTPQLHPRLPKQTPPQDPILSATLQNRNAHTPQIYAIETSRPLQYTLC